MKRSHIGPATLVVAAILVIVALVAKGPGTMPNPSRDQQIGSQLAAYASVHTGGGNPTSSALCGGGVIALQPELHVLRDAKFTTLVTICNPYAVAITFWAFMDEGTNAVIHQGLSQKMSTNTHLFGGEPDRYTGGWMNNWTGTIPPGGHVNFYDYLQVGPQPFNSALWNVDVYTSYEATRFVGHQVLIIDNL